MQAEGKLGWRFPRTFWYANGAELCERAAYYGMFITLVRYLNADVGFTDTETGLITALFAGGLYFLPTFMGIMADKIGFKQALMIAFAVLTGGYALLGAYQLKWTAVTALGLIMCGGAIIKPVISGTAAKCSTDENRARAMSIFYMVVNIGSFSGKGLAGVLNERLGMDVINFYAAAMCFLALVLVTLFYRNVDTEGTGKTVSQALRGLWTVMRNFRFLGLIVIIAGFWLIQGQLYGAMPTYIERVLGKGYKPEWLANINPLTVVILVVPITHVIRRFKPQSAIGIGMFIIPFTALVIALGTLLEKHTGNSVDLGLFSIHPIVLCMIVGIALQGLAECFLSPKFLEFASKQAPKGEVGLYLGYQHLTTFFAWLAGFIAAGLLLNRYCPDPRKLDPPTRHEWRLATDPQYRFTLDPADTDALRPTAVVPPALCDVLTSRGLDVAADAAIRELKARDWWRKDPERSWVIESPVRTMARSDLPRELHNELKDGEAVSDTLWTGIVAGDEPLPPHSYLRRVEQAGNDENWLIVVRQARIDESKLETDADAQKDGRDRARRDTVVLAMGPPTGKPSPLPVEYAHADRIWYAFAIIGFGAFGAMLVYIFVTNTLDRKSAGQGTPPV
ncbi:MAG: MFS transporter [Phycisphaerae bacterium]|nr:MFS transporter [Phycisphaerae bacterium]